MNQNAFDELIHFAAVHAKGCAAFSLKMKELGWLPSGRDREEFLKEIMEIVADSVRATLLFYQIVTEVVMKRAVVGQDTTVIRN